MSVSSDALGRCLERPSWYYGIGVYTIAIYGLMREIADHFASLLLIVFEIGTATCAQNNTDAIHPYAFNPRIV